MKKTSLDMPEELDKEISEQLQYGDYKSEWIREAIRLKLKIDPILKESGIEEKSGEKKEFVAEAVREKLERQDLETSR